MRLLHLNGNLKTTHVLVTNSLNPLLLAIQKRFFQKSLSHFFSQAPCKRAAVLRSKFFFFRNFCICFSGYTLSWFDQLVNQVIWRKTDHALLGVPPPPYFSKNYIKKQKSIVACQSVSSVCHYAFLHFLCCIICCVIRLELFLYFFIRFWLVTNENFKSSDWVDRQRLGLCNCPLLAMRERL